MKIKKDSIFYIGIKKGFDVIGFELFNKELEKNNNLISTLWNCYFYILKSDETLKDLRKTISAKDVHIDTMLLNIIKDLDYIKRVENV